MAAEFKHVLENVPSYKEILQTADILREKCEIVTEIQNICLQVSMHQSCHMKFNLNLTNMKRSFINSMCIIGMLIICLGLSACSNNTPKIFTSEFGVSIKLTEG